MEGKALIFSAPSGAGKTTIVRHLLTIFNTLEFSISACSRQKREGEIDGKDYYFLSPEEFKRRIEKDDFVEWEEVYKDLYYGTLKSELSRIWVKGNTIVFDVDVLGGINLKKKLGNQALSVFIMPPSIDELKNRLEKRGTETPESLKKRIDKATEEISKSSQFDIIIENDSLEKAFAESEKRIKEFLALN